MVFTGDLLPCSVLSLLFSAFGKTIPVLLSDDEKREKAATAFMLNLYNLSSRYVSALTWVSANPKINSTPKRKKNEAIKLQQPFDSPVPSLSKSASACLGVFHSSLVGHKAY